MGSYVISVSAGTGCYRHIQISKSATLYRLHEAILDAFEFVDDHAHAFFMDNKTWSQYDAYYSMKMDGHERLTKGRKLEKLNLKKGSQFKYVFNFGEEWRFQCKVLRELEVNTKTPMVIREVGQSPEQYPEYEDEEELLPEEELEKLYEEIPLSREEINRIHLYMDAAANLYGLIPMDELYALYNSQNPAVEELTFFMAVVAINLGSSDFEVIDSPGEHREPEKHPLKICELAADYLFVDDFETNIRGLRCAQKGKPLKILPKADFLRFADYTYFPEMPQRSAMIRYLRKLTSSLPASAEEYCDCIQSVIVVDAPLQEVFNILKEDGLTSHKNWDLEEFAALYQDLNNHTHKHANRGNTPDELFAQSVRGLRLQERLAPPENQPSFFEEPPQKPKLTIVGAPSRNGPCPCPCGSGRKYKNCCGKGEE